MEQNSSTGTFIANPFYIFISLLLGAITFFGIRDLWISGSSANAVFLFTLFLVHIGLFWSNVRDFENPRWWMFYYPIQVMLVLVIVNQPFTSDINLTLLGSSTLCLIGESLGLWGNTRRALYIGLSLFGFMLITLYILVERGQFIFAISNLLVNGGFIVLLMVMFNQQIAERQKAVDLAESLESANAKLAASSAKIESLTLQNERQRMARELHDTLAQGVAGLVLQLEAVKAHIGANRTERAAEIVEQSITRARSTLAESRAAIDDLRAAPANLTEAVHEKIDRFIQVTGIPCEMEVYVHENQLSPETTIHALNILSELLTNIARHAQATQVHVKWIVQNQNLELDVRDNGKGFDVNQKSSGSYGLIGMHERAKLTGGALAIESGSNGTCVQFIVGRS